MASNRAVENHMKLIKQRKKKPVVELDQDDIVFDFSTSVSLVSGCKNVVEIKGIIKDLETGNEVGMLRLVQLNFGSALDEKEDWQNIIDSVDDDLLETCEPLINAKKRGAYSEEFEQMLEGHDVFSPYTVIVISKVGFYKDYRGNNLLGSVLKAIRCLNSDAPIVAHPFPLQHNGNEENLKIMGIKSEKKTTRQIRLDNTNKLIKHYEKHGFERLANSETWVLI